MKTLISRWECSRRRTWIELYAYEVQGRTHYSYATSWGARGLFGTMTLSRVFDRIEHDRSLCISQLRQVPVPWKDVA